MSRAGRTLHEVQSHLDREGASDLVVELVINSIHSPSIFVEAVELGIALLEGGNPIIQKSMFSKLMGGELSQSFFKVFFDKMKEAQQEIKATVSVNTSDLAAKAHENKELHKESDKLSKKKCKFAFISPSLSQALQCTAPNSKITNFLNLNIISILFRIRHHQPCLNI